MTPWLLALLLGAETHPHPLVVHPRDQLLLVATSSGAELPGAVQRAFAAHTRLEVQSAPDAQRYTTCPADQRGRCWVEAAPQAPRLRYLLIAGATPLEAGKLRLQALLVDLQAARRACAAAAGEACERAVLDSFEPAALVVRARDQGALESFFAHAALPRFRPRLERNGHWGRERALELRGARAGLSILLDGALVGLSAEGGTTLLGLDRERHHLALRDAEGREHYAGDFLTREGETVLLAVPTPPAEPPLIQRPWLLAASAAALAAGTGLTVYALASKPDSSAYRLCPQAGCDPGGGGLLSFARLSDEPGLREPSRGLAIAPLGWSLALMGAAWAVSALLEPPEDFPWGLVAGLAAGGLSLGLSSALGGAD